MSEGGGGGGGGGGGASSAEVSDDGEQCNMSCLVAVGRALPDLAPAATAFVCPPPPTRQLQYVSRHAPDGKFLFVDQRHVYTTRTLL